MEERRVKRDDVRLVVDTLRRVADALEREVEKGKGETPVTDEVLATTPPPAVPDLPKPDAPLTDLDTMWAVFKEVFAWKLGKSWMSRKWVVAEFRGTDREGQLLRDQARQRGLRKVFVREGRAGFMIPEGVVVGRRTTYWPSGRLPVGYYDPADWDHDDDVSGPVFLAQTGEQDFW